jgi:hypothetical protein
MIGKDPGNSKVHRLHVIHIYEADYKFLNQAKWRESKTGKRHHNQDNMADAQGVTLLSLHSLKNSRMRSVMQAKNL